MLGTIYERILNERDELANQIDILNSKIKNFPNGKIICCRNGKYYKWFQSDGNIQTPISSKNRKLIEKLIEKEYLRNLLEDLSNEKQALELYLDKHNSYDKKVSKLFDKKPIFREYISNAFNPISAELKAWMDEPYERSEKYPEQLICKTIVGTYVRSKSENLIDMYLRKYHIPFRYECPLQLGEILVYPDFTIRHPRTGKTYYWEHYGMMEKLSYARNAFTKLDLYATNNIIPNVNMITTFETGKKPLQPEMVENIVKFYFL